MFESKFKMQSFEFFFCGYGNLIEKIRSLKIIEVE